MDNNRESRGAAEEEKLRARLSAVTGYRSRMEDSVRWGDSAVDRGQAAAVGGSRGYWIRPSTSRIFCVVVMGYRSEQGRFGRGGSN